jgi:hypothetical protein
MDGLLLNNDKFLTFKYINKMTLAVKSLKDFVKYLFETAETPQQKQMLREALQSSMM